MEFTNDSLVKMHDKKIKYNDKFSKYYYTLFREYNPNYDKVISDGKGKQMLVNSSTGEIYKDDTNLGVVLSRYYNKSEAIKNCMNLWKWDVYHKNLLMDLKQVNRCKNNRFCPNCKLLDISKFIHKFNETAMPFIAKGYKMYMCTLTVPNCTGDELKETIEKMSKSFAKFFRKFDESSVKPYHDRKFSIGGGVRVLEITHNDHNDTYHPHYHCVFFCKDIEYCDLEKNQKGLYSNKRNSYDYKSTIDLQIGLIWSLVWHNIQITKANLKIFKCTTTALYLDENEEYRNLCQNDFREMDEKGFYEVFKYTVKDSDIHNYNVFKTIVMALDYKRIRQGFGFLYNMKCEEVETGEYEELMLENNESPELLITKEISELYINYKSYKKISRFNPIINNNIKED